MGSDGFHAGEFSQTIRVEAMNWNTIVSAEALLLELGNPDLIIVDARFVLGDAQAGEQAWQTAHLPKASYVHLDRDLSDKQKPAHFGRHPLPNADDFCQTLMRCGISRQSQVVVYDANDGAMAAARFWYLLKLLGHDNVAVLDGGFARWLELGLPVNNEAPVLLPSLYHADFDQTQIVIADAIKNNLTAHDFVLLDARAAERYRGEVEPIDKIAGHIPGALNRPYSLNLENGRFRAAEVLKQEFLALLGRHRASETILYCGSGVTACHNLLAMEVAGLHGAKIFPPSWSGWISDPENS
jgi:thiosulfate/3-mercaptopyruvate sulfurtransferase